MNDEPKTTTARYDHAKMNDDLTRLINRKRRTDIFVQLIGLVVVIAAIWLCLIWLGWRTLLVIFLFLFSNNIAQRNDR